MTTQAGMPHATQAEGVRYYFTRLSRMFSP